MIPKIIHYCWFGKGPKTDLHRRCIESWKKYLPDYTIMEWNEGNFDIDKNNYVKQAYQNKKYAFVSDYARLEALYEYGGIYFDLDVEVKQNLDDFLKYDAVFSFESVNIVASAILFSEKNNDIIKMWLDSYEDRVFSDGQGVDLTTNVYKITELLKQIGFIINGQTQEIRNVKIYEKSFFCPYGIGDSVKEINTESYTIHWCEGSWFDEKMQKKIKLIKLIKRVIGTQNYYSILKIIKRGR